MKLKYSFINPNTDENTSEVLLKIFAEANIPFIDEIILNTDKVQLTDIVG